MDDLFDPDRGKFAKNIRAAGGDDTELRESLKSFGWLKEFPALADENGVVLVGNRRVKLAKELGIEPVVETITFGKGTAADAERLKLAIASNIGFQSMTPEDRKRIAAHLYGAEWTMQRIAEALGVTHKTISKDLNCTGGTNYVRPKTASNPKGAGRPKGSKLRPEFRKNTTLKAEVAASLVLDKGKTYSEVEAASGLSSTVIRSAVAREEGRREAPPIDPDLMPHSMKARYDATIRRATVELTQKITDVVTRKIHQEWDELWIPEYKKKLERADRILENFKGLISRQDFRKIKACLHPDHNTFQFAAEALQIFSKLEDRMVKPEPAEMSGPPLPKTVAELLKRKAAVTQARRDKRAAML